MVPGTMPGAIPVLRGLKSQLSLWHLLLKFPMSWSAPKSRDLVEKCLKAVEVLFPQPCECWVRNFLQHGLGHSFQTSSQSENHMNTMEILYVMRPGAVKKKKKGLMIKQFITRNDPPQSVTGNQSLHNSVFSTFLTRKSLFKSKLSSPVPFDGYKHTPHHPLCLQVSQKC